MQSNKQSIITVKKTLVSLAIFAYFVLNSTHHVSAYTINKLSVENNEDFVVEPGKTEVFLNPGETVTKTISVTNRTNRTLDYKVGVENFVGSNNSESAVVLLPPGTDTPYPLDNYVQPEVDHFTLEFGEKITFDVTIKTPSDIAPGGHYGAVIISNESPGQIDENGNEVRSGTQLTSRIGSLILMRINGNVKESGFLQSFLISGPYKWFQQKMPTSFEVAFKNDGTVHLVPYGTINIKNLFGVNIAEIPVDAYFALPDSTRYQTIDWGGKKFSFGLYTANLDLYKGYGSQLDHKKIWFFVLPLMVLIPAFVLFVLVFAVMYFLSKKFEFKRK